MWMPAIRLEKAGTIVLQTVGRVFAAVSEQQVSAVHGAHAVSFASAGSATPCHKDNRALQCAHPMPKARAVTTPKDELVVMTCRQEPHRSSLVIEGQSAFGSANLLAVKWRGPVSCFAIHCRHAWAPGTCRAGHQGCAQAGTAAASESWTLGDVRPSSHSVVSRAAAQL